MSILIFLGILFVLVLVHELGHFFVAKWTKMRVDEFGIGFPPKLFGIKKGETEYTLNLFPIGGFVKIRGEDGVADASVRAESMQSNDSFVSKSKWAQSAVLVAGVTMNILFAWTLVTSAFMIGVQSTVSGEEATEHARLAITGVLPNGPAEKAGVPVGASVVDIVVHNQTLPARTPEAFSRMIETHGTDPITLVYEYEQEIRMVNIIPEEGILVESKESPAIGVALALIDTIPRSFLESVRDASLYVVSQLRDITVGIARLLIDAVQFKADFSHVAGPVGIVGLVGEASAYGFTSLLMFTAFISLNLAVINILPFPALDGGRLLFVVIEAVTRRSIPATYAVWLNSIGFLFLILLMVAVTWNDIARLM